jgi:hypothetical protein
VLAVAACAVLAGARSLAAIGEWAADAPGQVLAALGVRRDPLTGAFRPPAEATVRRVLARVDPDALDQAIGAWLAGQQLPPPTRPPARRLAGHPQDPRCHLRRGRLPGPHRHRPAAMASLRNLAIGILRRHGHRNIAAALRYDARHTTRIPPPLGITSP